MKAQTMEHFLNWIGNRKVATDRLTKQSVERFKAVINADMDSSNQWGLHWCIAPEVAYPADLGEDGHVALGKFLPPIPLSSRMWASNETVFFAPLPVDADITKTSIIKNVVEKQGKSGSLVFVTVDHIYESDETVLVQDTQTIVYRNPAPYQVAPPAPPGTATTIKTISPNVTQLFRYSAITFNGHRIHYDADYARSKEGYPGLVVHGPLMATMLMQMAGELRPGCRLERFQFRGMSPAFANQPLHLRAMDDRFTTFEIRNENDAIIMKAKATFVES